MLMLKIDELVLVKMSNPSPSNLKSLTRSATGPVGERQESVGCDPFRVQCAS